MAYVLIKGTFHVLNKEPDGDSVRFKAANSALWKKLTTQDGEPAKVKPSTVDETVQLRIESIDALETHFPTSKHNQPMKLAKLATETILKLLGFKNPVFNASGKKIIDVDNNGVEGYILTRYIDNPRYGGPVSFVFAGKTAVPDGKDNVFLTPALLKQSVNYKMMLAGLVYPVFYDTLFYDLRNEFNNALKKAKANKKNIWASAGGDTSQKGFSWNLVDIENKEIIYPKLFRRIIAFHIDESITYPKTTKNFKEKYLPTLGDKLEVMSINHTTSSLDYVIKVVSAKKLQLLYPLEDIKFFQPVKRK
jgi:endonuclease YncB( thermonuclease family)